MRSIQLALQRLDALPEEGGSGAGTPDVHAVNAATARLDIASAGAAATAVTAPSTNPTPSSTPTSTPTASTSTPAHLPKDSLQQLVLQEFTR